MAEILYADDDEGFRELIGDFLKSQGHATRIVGNGTEALAEVRRSPPDLILLDYRMGEPDGVAVCRKLKSDPRYGHIPVVILTGEGMIDHRLEGFEAGADDYVQKPVDARELAARIRALLELSRRGLDRNPSSGLPGGEAISREFERRRAEGAAFAVCYLDLDDFKPFGDRFGFPVSDAVIREVGALLQHRTEGSDAFAGHIGGDDFVLFCDGPEARSTVSWLLEELKSRVRAHVPPQIATAGAYVGKDRNGVIREFPLTSLSAAILQVPAGYQGSLQELGEHAARAKARAKAAESGVEEVSLSESL